MDFGVFMFLTAPQCNESVLSVFVLFIPVL